MEVSVLGQIMTEANVGVKTFYGFRQDKKTGLVSVDVISPGEEATIRLPQPGLNDDRDYLVYFWSEDTLFFSVDSSGRLIMRVV